MSLYVTTLLPDSAAEGSPGVDELRWLRPVQPSEELFVRTDGDNVLTLILNSRFCRRPTSD